MATRGWEPPKRGEAESGPEEPLFGFFNSLTESILPSPGGGFPFRGCHKELLQEGCLQRKESDTVSKSGVFALQAALLRCQEILLQHLTRGRGTGKERRSTGKRQAVRLPLPSPSPQPLSHQGRGASMARPRYSIPSPRRGRGTGRGGSNYGKALSRTATVAFPLSPTPLPRGERGFCETLHVRAGHRQVPDKKAHPRKGWAFLSGA